MRVNVVEGDLLDQKVDAIVNAWNRNTIPWWLLLPQGVSGAIKRKGGTAPFRELRRTGRMALGSAVVTGPGRLPFKGIIHVAGINDFWQSNETVIRSCVRNALGAATQACYASLALPLIGAGSGSFDPSEAEEIILDELSKSDVNMDVTVVRFRRVA
jgi:O-acetyl-ADP-ribose deacetylase (regulator of RNase III)